ncbi:OmpH family outer membrane protein [Paracoccus subflavus]|nr:OmpH family outer membrane protein [Paracoccus subflavus]
MPSQTIPAPADSSPVAAIPLLTVDQEALFSRSAWGRRTQRVLEETGREVAAENERLATQLAAEESELTDQRPTLDPAEFRRLAEAFDARATAIRRERAQVVEDLNGWAEADRAAFYRAALPLMGEMMQERGAVAVLDRRTVFVSLDAIDMTDDLVARLDADLGDGQGTVPLTVPQDQQN